MSQSLDVRILLPQHKEALLSFAKANWLKRFEHDPMEGEMQSWSARWRGEALDHYLSLGWSFALFKNDLPEDFILAQPMVFHRGLTQTLWVEDVFYDSSEPENARILIETAHKWARDKHFQCVLVETTLALEVILSSFPKAHKIDTSLMEIRTAKF